MADHPEATLEVLEGSGDYDGMVVIMIEHVAMIEAPEPGISHRCAIAVSPQEAYHVARRINEVLKKTR